MYFGEKSLIKHFPEIEENNISLEEILNKARNKLNDGSKDRGSKKFI